MGQDESSPLSEDAQNMKRAIDSIQEEFGAIDWYKQRADACTDNDLKNIMLHNIREEEEHAAMLIAWVKNHDTDMAEMLNKILPRASADIAKE